MCPKESEPPGSSPSCHGTLVFSLLKQSGSSSPGFCTSQIRPETSPLHTSPSFAWFLITLVLKSWLFLDLCVITRYCIKPGGIMLAELCLNFTALAFCPFYFPSAVRKPACLLLMSSCKRQQCEVWVTVVNVPCSVSVLATEKAPLSQHP